MVAIRTLIICHKSPKFRNSNHLNLIKKGRRPAWSEAGETRTVTHRHLGRLVTWSPGKFRACLGAWDLSSARPCALASFLSEEANESGHRQQKDQSPPEKKTRVCLQASGLGVMNRTQRHHLRRRAMAPKDFWRFCAHQ